MTNKEIFDSKIYLFEKLATKYNLEFQKSSQDFQIYPSASYKIDKKYKIKHKLSVAYEFMVEYKTDKLLFKFQIKSKAYRCKELREAIDPSKIKKQCFENFNIENIGDNEIKQLFDDMYTKYEKQIEVFYTINNKE